MSVGAQGGTFAAGAAGTVPGAVLGGVVGGLSCENCSEKK